MLGKENIHRKQGQKIDEINCEKEKFGMFRVYFEDFPFLTSTLYTWKRLRKRWIQEAENGRTDRFQGKKTTNKGRKELFWGNIVSNIGYWNEEKELKKWIKSGNRGNSVGNRLLEKPRTWWN